MIFNNDNVSANNINMTATIIIMIIIIVLIITIASITNGITIAKMKINRINKHNTNVFIVTGNVTLSYFLQFVDVFISIYDLAFTARLCFLCFPTAVLGTFRPYWLHLDTLY